MRKILGWFLVLLFVAGICGAAVAQVGEKRAELEKVKNYIKVLDQKIENARKAKQINKIAQLKDLKRKELARAKALQKEIARLEKAPPGPSPKARGRAVGPRQRAVGSRGRGFQLSAGYGGGAGIIGAGYYIPIAAVDLEIGAGYGIGNKYSILTAGVAGVMPLGNFCVGLEGGMANYSENVENIPGISGQIDKGSKAGVGIFAGTKLGMISARIGYNSALGLTAGAVYKF